MVAIVAGQGLGLVNTSGGLLGSQGQIGVAGQGGSGERVTVNASTGNLVVQQQDEWLIGRGPDTAVLRTYNSLGGADGDNGDQWRLGLSRKVNGLTRTVNTAGSTVKRIGEDGSETIFTYSSAQGVYTSWAGSGSVDTLRYSAGVWTWSDQDSRISETYDHNQGGRLTTVRDASGNTLSIGYNAAGHVNEVTDAAGQKTQIIYDTAAGKTANILQVRTVNAEGQQRTRTSYVYDGASRLARVTVDLTPENTTDSKTYTTDYTYVDPSSRKLASLKQSDGSELQFTYDGNGRIATVKDVRGSDIRATTFDYTVAGQTSITDAAGRVVRLKYQTAAGQNQYQLTSIDAPGAGSVRQVTTFAYDANGNVANVADAQGKTTVYGYDSLGHRIYERDAAGNVVQRLYGAASQLLSETRYVQPDPDGGSDAQPGAPLTTRYVYDDQQRLRFVVSPEGRVTEHRYDALGQKTSELTYTESMDIPAGWSQDFSTNADGLTPLPSLMQLVPGGLELKGQKGSSKVYHSATGLRELSLGSSLHAEVRAGSATAGRSIVIGFTNGLPGADERRFAVYFNNNELRGHFYDGRGGATSTSSLMTADANKSYSIDVVVDANGDAALYVYEKGKDRASGISYRHSGFGWTSLKTYLQTQISADWNATTHTMLISELTETPGYTGAALTAWAAAQGPKALSRTDYTYDVRGQVASRTVFAQLDSTGKGVPDGTQASTQYVYDQFGNLLQRIDPRGAATAAAGDYVTTYAYDGLNRLVSSTDALNGLSTSVYEDANRKVTTTAANGLVTVTVRDQGGQILSVESRDGALLGSTTYGYDKLGRRVKTTDASGRSSYTLYDEAGRVSAQIDAEGALTEYRYDRRDQLVQTIAYANKPTAAQLSSLAGNPAQSVAAVLPMPSPALDRVTRRLYNAVGQLVKTIDAAGAVTQLTYDGLGRQTGSVQYATLLSSTQLAALAGSGTEIDPGDANATVASSTDDRRTRQIWSDDGLLAATVDGGGYVHKHEYNAAGQRIATTRYANRTGPSDWSTGTLATLLPVPNSAQDQSTRYLYDKAGQLQGTLDAEGYLTVYKYDLSGNQIEETRYATRVTNPNGVDVAAMQPTGTGLDRTVLRQFDALQRLVREESRPDGLVTTYTYDKVGNLLKSEQGVGAPAAEQRTTLRRYDALGRLTGELGPRGAAALAQLGSSHTPAQFEDIWARYGTRHLYDTTGRRIASIASNGADAAGNKTLYYYDAQGRMTHSINALGEVTEYSYNSFGEQVQQRRYATRLTGAKLSTLSGGLASAWTSAATDLTQSALDNLQQTGYDMRGLLASRTDALDNTDTFAYNAFGEQRQRIERLNASGTRQTDLLYDRRGNLYSSALDAGTGKLNLTSSTVYDAFGRAIQSTDARGNTTHYSYDKLGRTLSITDPVNPARVTSYDAFGRVLTQRDALGNTVTTTYDGPARSITMRTQEGVSVKTVLNRHGQTVSVMDGLNNTTVYTYDTDGQLKSTAAPGMGTASSSFDAAGRLISSTDAGGTITTYAYDQASRVLTRTVDPGAGKLNLTTLYEYDALGRTVKTTAPDGAVTFSEFDPAGNLKAVTQDHGRLNLKTTYTYDAQGRTLTVVEGAGSATTRTTEYRYDAAGRRTHEIVDPAVLKLTTLYSYDRAGNLIERTDAALGKTRYVYDAAGQLRYTVDAVGGTTRTSYDANGRVEETRAYDKAINLPALADAAAGYTVAQLDTLVAGLGARVQRTLYDRDGRVHYTMDAVGSVTRRGYDKAGNVTTVRQFATTVDPATATRAVMEALVTTTQDRLSYTVYDAANRPVYQIDALKHVTSMAYDTAGRVIRQTQRANAIETLPTTLTLNSVYGSLRLDDTRDRTTHWAYDTAGRQRYEVDAERYVTERVYDALGRERQTIRYDARITLPTSVSVTSVKAAVPATPGARDVVTESGYDTAGRLIEQVDGEQVVTRYTLDALGRVQSKVSAFGRPEKIQTDYTYDAAGRKLTETLAPGTAVAATTRYSYDGMGRVRTVLRPGGVELTTSNSDWAKVERTRLGFATTLGGLVETKKVQLRALYTTEYRYDAEGRLIQQIDASGMTAAGITTTTTTTTTRNAFGEAVVVTDGTGATTYTLRDALGRDIGSVDAEGYLLLNIYDAFGNRTYTSRYANKVQGDLSRVPTEGIAHLNQSLGTSPPTGGKPWLYAYDDSNSNEVLAYDKLDRLTGVTNAAGTETKELDAFGQAGKVTNRVGGTASFTYDKLGRVLTETLPVQRRNTANVLVDVVHHYRYDAHGNRTQTIEAVGLPEQRTTEYRFDKANRQTEKRAMAFSAFHNASDAPSTVTPAELTRYDGNGRVIEVVANANMHSGAPVGGARTLSYYDAAGNKTGQIDADGAYTRYTHTPDGLVLRETAHAVRVALPATAGGTPPAPSTATNTATGADRVTHHRYTSQGRLAESRREGVVHWEAPADAANSAVVLQAQGPDTIVMGQLQYDAAGRVVQETDGRGNSLFSYYDKLGRKVLAIDQEGYATVWEYGHLTQAATKETRYANRVMVAFGRQNDTAVAAALRDPLALKNTIAPSADDRITEYTLDPLGRVTEKRVKNVASTHVDAAGTPTTRVADAVTGYTYDGLSNVTQTRERVSDLANGSTVVNVTDTFFDKLGRQVQRLAPGYNDHTGTTGQWVRPTTDTEYNGLGNVVREIQRGLDGASEADDRITRYGYNANGDRIQVIDAKNNVTDIGYDALRRVERTTVRNVKDADNNVRDVQTRYAFDTMGRQTMQWDLGTGEVRRTEYNAFGEISRKGLADGWQEFIEYNTLGKIQRSNNEGGVTKIYLYDRTGNTTRQISSGTTDLRTTSVLAAAQDTTLLHTFSVYDKRSQLVKTVEPDISFQRDEFSMQRAFTQQLADLYGPISVANAGGGSYATGAVDSTGFNYTQVSGGGASTTVSGDKLAKADVIGGKYVSPANQATKALPPLTLTEYVLNWGATYFHRLPNSLTLTLPSDWAAGTYSVTRFDGRIETGVKGLGEPLILNLGLPYHEVDAPGEGGYTIPVWELEAKVVRHLPGNQKITVSTLRSTYSKKSIDVGEGNGQEIKFILESFEPRRIILEAPANVENFILQSAGVRTDLNLSPLTDINGSIIPRYYQITHTNPATFTWGTGAAIYGVDSNGVRLVGEHVSAIGSGDNLFVAAKASILEYDVVGDSSILKFTPNAIGGTSGTFFYRKAGTQDNWNSVPFSNSTVHIQSLLSPGQYYDYTVKTATHETSGDYFHQSGIPYQRMLSPIFRSPQQILFNVSRQVLGSELSYFANARFTGFDGKEVRITKSIVGGVLSFDVANELAGLGIDPYTNKGVNYGFEIFAQRPNGEVQVVSGNWGSMQLGSDFWSSPPSNGLYRPIARLVVPGATGLTGALTIAPQDAPWEAVSIGPDHWSRTADSGGLNIDLSRWHWPRPRNFIISYASHDARFSATFSMNANAEVQIEGTISQWARQPKVTLSVAGATRLSVLKVGPDNANLANVGIEARVTTSGSTFVWDVGDLLGKTNQRFYYEAVNNSGVVVGAGYGTLKSVATNGEVQYEPDPTPVLRPPVVSFTPPAQTQRFEVTIRPQGGAASSLFSTTNGTLQPDNGRYVLHVPLHLRPAPGQPAARHLIEPYRAWNSAGELVSSGKAVLTIDSTGVATVTEAVEDRKPTVVKLQGPLGRLVHRLQIDLEGVTDPIYIPGTWDATQNRTFFNWDASGLTPTSGTAAYNYTLTLQNADGTNAVNEVGEAYLPIKGVMTLGGSQSAPVSFKQTVNVLTVPAQVERRLDYNAFGQIAGEYDMRVKERAEAMTTQYGGTVDPAAVRTTLQYNTLGQLTTKTDPQTHVTAENGYRYRDRPTTRYGYDLLGRLVASTDANGNVTRQNYVGEGNARVGQQWAAEAGVVSKVQYDVFGDARKLTDPLNAVTLQNFDKLGQLEEVQRLSISRVQNLSGIDAVASTLRDLYSYDALGQRITHTNARNWVDKTYYDSLGRITKTTTAEGRSTSYSYLFVPAGSNPGILGAGNRNTGGYQRKTSYADGRFVLDNIDYFGLTTWHQDLGGRTYAYNYDWGGRLASQQSSAGQNIQYAYYANGYIREAKDLAEGTLARYGYDNAGNRVWEAYSQMDGQGNPGASYQSATISYDELNRMSRVKDDLQQLDVQYEYDAVGNRRAVHAYYWDPATQDKRREDHLWYKYDQMNRFVLTMGSFNGPRGTSLSDTRGFIERGADGSVIGYDKASRRVSAESARGGKELYRYTTDGYLEDVRLDDGTAGGKLLTRRRVDALGRTLEYIDAADGNKATTSVYDRDNRLLEQKNVDGVTKYFYATDTADTDATASQSGAGSLLRTEFTPSGKATETKTWYTYTYWDEAKQSTIQMQAFDANVRSWAPGISDLRYNVNGFLKSAHNVAVDESTHYFTSAHGQILRRNRIQKGQAVGNHYFYYADGRRIGDVTDTDKLERHRVSYAEAQALKDKTVDRKTLYKNFKPVTSSDFDQNYEPINETYPAAVGATYTVRGGETLQGIARALWGDAAMWYLLAEANGLTGTEALVAGRVLQVPNKVTNIHNNADTFRPYNPGEAIGRIDPTLPAPKLKKGCGVIGQIVMVVVAVAATVFTAGALTAGLGAGFQGIMSAGFSALTGGAVGVAGTAGMMAGASGAAAAIGGAVGSIVSQGAGVAMGMQDSFSWKQVGLSALGAGVTAGLGGSGNAWMAAGKATLGSTITQGLGVALGLQDRFSWAGVAASAAGAGAGKALGPWVGWTWGKALGPIGTQVMTGMAGSAVAHLVGSGRVDVRSAFATTLGQVLGESFADGSLFGNALGDSLASASSGDAFGMTAGEAEERAAAREVFVDGQRDALYGFSTGSVGPGLRIGGGYGLTAGGYRASGVDADNSAIEPVTTAAGGDYDDSDARHSTPESLAKLDAALAANNKAYAAEQRAAAQARAVQQASYFNANYGNEGRSFAGAQAANYFNANYYEQNPVSRAAEQMGDEIAPLADLRGTVRGISGSAEASGVAADFQRRAEILMQSASQARAGGSSTMAMAYERAAGNYIVAGGEAGRAGASFIDGASVPRAFVNPPEFQVPAGWSYMGQNNVGKPVMAADYLSLNFGLYVAGGGVSVNLHSGEWYGQWALGRAYPAYGLKPSITLTVGKIIGGNGTADTHSFLTGGSAQAAHFAPVPVAPFIGWGGGLNHSYGGKTAIEAGLSIPWGTSVAPAGYGFKN